MVAAFTIGACADEARRDRQLQPQRVLDAVGLSPGMVVAEIGAGSGYFTVKLARRVGSGGKVYANDIDKEALKKLEERCADEGITTVTTVLGKVDDPLLPSARFDMVFVVYALHDFHTKIVVLDQNPDITGDDHFLTPDRILELFREAGFELVARHDFLERDLVLVFRLASGNDR
jgi:predicted methyltransferase